MKYLIYQVGCIECVVSSYPIKVVETIEEAKRIRDAHPSTWESAGGEGFVTIIDLENCVEVHD